MPDNKYEALSTERKLEIIQYVSALIKGWLSWVGVANLAVLVGAVVYIFFVLPGKALTEATNLFERKVENIEEKTNNMSEGIGRMKERLDSNNTELNDVSAKLTTKKKKALYGFQTGTWG